MTFRINCEWFGDAAERAAFAEVSISVGGNCATEVHDTFAKTVRASARLSAFELAQWFAFNWWRLLWEPESDGYSWDASHKMGNAGGGFVWPNLSFSSDWQSVLVSARPTIPRDAEPIRYLNRFDESAPIADFEREVSGFVDRTVARLSSAGSAQSELSVLWDEVNAERRDAEIANRRIIEACMGYDPDEAPDGLLDFVVEQTSAYGKGAIREVAAEHKGESVSYVNRVRENAKKSGMMASAPNLSDIRNSLASADSDIPWIQAESAARAARGIWGAPAPISDRALCGFLDISQSAFLTVPDSAGMALIAGVRDGGASGGFRVSLTAKHPHSRRFGLARLLADHIIADDGEALLPATRQKTVRQKFQRAFAREFLCPFDDLREFLGDAAPSDEVIQDASDYFNVSPLMIHAALVDKGVLRRESLGAWDV